MITHPLPLILKELNILCPEKSLTLITAESCTGGGIAFEITSLPGSSRWFAGGFIAYSNLEKIKMLEVEGQTIEQYGAVSAQVATQMAEGALRNSQASLSLSVTGIAGPAGGCLEKPVGTCWFAWASPYFETICQQQIFSGDRIAIRFQAIFFALEKLLQWVKKISV